LGLELLLCQDREQAWKLARQLDVLNRERQRQQAEALELARRLLDEQDASSPLLMLGHEGIAPGVAGLVASRLADDLYRPCVVYSPDGTISRASARSIEEFDMASALRECGDLFLRFGGHRQAAGFTADNERLPEIRERLVACARERLAGLDLTPVIDVDAVVPLADIGGEEIRWLQRMAPYGVGNTEPVFWSRGVTVVEGRTVGADDQHLRLKLKDARVVWPAIGFGLGDVPVRAGSKVDIVYSIGSDRGGYGSLQLLLHDLTPSA
jgi:single-stranded-DNA-specific exonuclease